MKANQSYSRTYPVKNEIRKTRDHLKEYKRKERTEQTKGILECWSSSHY